jgi:hypothetical protein
MQSSRSTIINVISALHAIQRIARTRSSTSNRLSRRHATGSGPNYRARCIGVSRNRSANRDVSDAFIRPKSE